METVIKYVITPQTRTGIAVYKCEVACAQKSWHVQFAKGIRIAGGGVPRKLKPNGYYYYSYDQARYSDQSIFDTEYEALVEYIKQAQYTRNKPVGQLAQTFLVNFIAAARKRLTELDPPEAAIEDTLVIEPIIEVKVDRG